MNRFMSRGMGGALVLAALVSSYSANAAEQFNVQLFNRVVATIVRSVLDSHRAGPNPLVTELTLSLDERGTDLSSNDRIRVQLNARATATRAAWAPTGNTTLELQLAGGADRLKKEAELSVGGRLETDVVGLGRYLAAEMEKSTCDSKRKERHSEAVVSQACEASKRLKTVADMKGLFLGIAELSALQVEYAKGEVTYAEGQLAKATDKNRRWAERAVTKARADLATSEKVLAEIRRANTAGAETGTYRFDLRALEIRNVGEIRQLEIYLDKNQIHLNVSFKMTDVKDIDGYFTMKPELEKALVALQNNEPNAVRAVTDLAKFYLEIVAGVLGTRK